MGEDADRADRNALRRMNRRRDFPENTCPASRHAAMMAEALIREGAYPMIESEPAHVGGSIAATVSSLWEARSFLQKLGYDWTVTADGKRTYWRKRPAPRPETAPGEEGA